MQRWITDRPDVTLRMLRPSEAPVLFALIDRNRGHLRQWLPWLDDSRSATDTLNFLRQQWAGWQRGDSLLMGIYHSMALGGTIGFHGFDRHNRITSLGYWLAKPLCGRGIMRAAVQVSLRYAFMEQAMNRVVIRCATGNRASRRIPESLGFTHEGTQRDAEWLYDHFVDLEMYSLLAGEWKSRFLVPRD